MTDPTPIGLGGWAPTLVHGQANPEAQKYGRLWALPEYRKIAPGEATAQVFLQIGRLPKGAHVLDFGTGTGRGALMLALLGQCKVTMIDFVNNCLDDEIRQATVTQPHALAFLKADLELPLPIAAPWGFCSDVMEHIPPDRVTRVLSNILAAAQHVFFSIATTPDHCGQLIGETLHLTVQPFAWWREQLKTLGCTIHWESDQPGAALFYVTNWAAGREIVNSGRLNEEEIKIRDNVAWNIRDDHGWATIAPAQDVEDEFLILGGGPSLAHYADEIREKRAAGMKLATLNGAYHWAIEHGLTPSCQIIMDSRPFNARFTRPVVDQCKYLLASQVHPSVLEGLPPDRTWLFHTMPGLIGDLLDQRYGPNRWVHVAGGSTVLLRAIPLLRILGYRKFHLYGCDSCITPDAHHAYPQPENDTELRLAVSISDGALALGEAPTPSGRTFWCHPWMVSQAQEFIDLIEHWGSAFDLAVYGDGLLAHILEAGARGMDEKGD